jgi:phage repressor protein C with HTH and peptisase S24 domain
MRIEEIYRARLKMLAAEAGSQSALAAMLDKSPAQVSQWINASKDSRTGKPRAMDRSTAREIEKKCGKPDGWMDQPVEDSGYNPNDFTPVRRADVAFSNGLGQVVYHEDDKPPLVFRSDFLRRLGIAPGNAVVVDAQGISNEPKIVDGSVVLVNRGDREHLDGDFFAFRYDGELLIKRLQSVDGVGVLATAENPNFKPKTRVYSNTSTGEIDVIGRAVWTGSML